MGSSGPPAEAFSGTVPALKYGDRAIDARTALETLSTKVGLVLVVLGAMHFFNLLIFSKLRRRATLHRPPPLPPQYR